MILSYESSDQHFMPDYKNGKIYKLTSSTNKKCYIGSTTEFKADKTPGGLQTASTRQLSMVYVF